jgi:hypothetical protein
MHIFVIKKVKKQKKSVAMTPVRDFTVQSALTTYVTTSSMVVPLPTSYVDVPPDQMFHIILISSMRSPNLDAALRQAFSGLDGKHTARHPCAQLHHINFVFWQSTGFVC